MRCVRFSGFEVIGFFGVMAPANTPPGIVARLNGEIAKVLEPGNKTAAEFSDYIKAETENGARSSRKRASPRNERPEGSCIQRNLSS
jgi:tripartite-type tricarboxylate transporter receptor subunit TctC